MHVIFCMSSCDHRLRAFKVVAFCGGNATYQPISGHAIMTTLVTFHPSMRKKKSEIYFDA
ncbi:hypothetical protein MUK42_35652 [Musa troglodytarum]|uniref:Uncharacterized protein n=1 Tax=Musa troglodytarum TaxID=320322 RepID=A0A9E7KXC5_9LILI|nr:hypothetical protein MUK42_35652 [Musa troglodytarum]